MCHNFAHEYDNDPEWLSVSMLQIKYREKVTGADQVGIMHR